MNADERRLAVLRAIVHDYVHTHEPVGSKALVERHQLGVSPATIRNDMAALEEDGLIAQPHTSAGRVPTDAGYRLFVDRLNQPRPLSPAEKRAIATVLDQAHDLNDVLDRTVRLLAQLTHQVALVQYPSLSTETLRHIELVHLGGSRLLVVVITATGQVEQRSILLDQVPDDALLGELRARMNEAVDGQQIVAARGRLDGVLAQLGAQDQELGTVIVDAVTDALTHHREDRVVLAGTGNLLRARGEFADSYTAVLDAIDEQVVILRLLGELDDDPASGLAISIGRENPHDDLREVSVVASGYGGGEGTGRLGVVGPTRMDYPSTMSAVYAVARYLSRVLGAGGTA